MIYLDNAATTKMSRAAIEAYQKADEEYFANADSPHMGGRKAERIFDRAKEAMCVLLGLEGYRYVATSGATEANNLFLRAVVRDYAGRGNRVITSAYEHPSVYNVLRKLEEEGLIDLVVLEGNPDGVVTPEELSKVMDGKTILVSLMAINNETGAISDIEGLSKVIRKYPKCLFHCDATQAVGKYPLGKGADAYSFSAHKFHGPKGIGGLLLKKGIEVGPLTYGGEQEGGMRPGTSNVPGLLSSYAALREEMGAMDENLAKCGAIWNKLHAYFASIPEEVRINSPLEGYKGIINVSLTKKKASVVVEALSEQGFYVSSVSACSTKSEPYSRVLRAMGKSEGDYHNSIRISYDRHIEEEDIDAFIKAFDKILREVKDRG